VAQFGQVYSNVSQLIEIIEKHKESALNFEKKICDKIIKSSSSDNYVSIDGIRYPKNKLERTELGNTFYNHIGLLSLILKLYKADQ
jgi:hypothetical protein